MTYNEATLLAVTGEKLLLPGWEGYFYWNFNNHSIEFKNGSYHLDNKQLLDLKINERTDWYYII